MGNFLVGSDFHVFKKKFYSDDEEIHNIEIRRLGGGFGFSIRGGAEYNSALCVLRIADGGAAEKDGRLRVRVLRSLAAGVGIIFSLPFLPSPPSPPLLGW